MLERQKHKLYRKAVSAIIRYMKSPSKKNENDALWGSVILVMLMGEL